MREHVNPFCKTPAAIKHAPLSNRMAYRVSGGHVDKETMQYIPEFQAVDTVEEIQACKDLCGLEYMKKLLKTGQVSPEDLQDDGKSGIDTSLVPESVHEANQLAQKENENIQKVAQAVGLKEGEKYSQAQFEAAVESAVKKVFEEAQAKAAQAQEGEGK